jgi:hypothetical protein
MIDPSTDGEPIDLYELMRRKPKMPWRRLRLTHFDDGRVHIVGGDSKKLTKENCARMRRLGVESAPNQKVWRFENISALFERINLPEGLRGTEEILAAIHYEYTSESIESLEDFRERISPHIERLNIWKSKMALLSGDQVEKAREIKRLGTILSLNKKFFGEEA